jgi:hypothetical protein
MKFILSITCVSTLIVFVIITGCAGIKDDIDANTATIQSCQECHSDSTAVGNQIIGADCGYENSGHYLGPRTLDPYVATTGHMYVFHGTNAMYSNADGCARCHTHQGFVDYVENGITDTVVPSASPPGCFSCHAPHDTGDFTLRTTAAVTLVDGTTTFDYGDGNLCVACHLAESTVDEFLDPSQFKDEAWPDSVKSYKGPHHGPQSDFILGKNNWEYTDPITLIKVDYYGASEHVTDSRAPDSCVSCHHYQPDGRFRGNPELGGHGFYLTAAVHGSSKDIVETCVVCHSTSKFQTSYPGGPYKGFTSNTLTAASDWDASGTTENILLEIQGLRDTLVSYFGDGATYFTGAGTGPIKDATASPAADQTTGEWNRDWVFQDATLEEWQAQSLWNFKYFMDDKSQGIHNPIFAAQILYDAIQNLIDKGEPLTVGTTRPPN